jgi:hypothetical protein
MVFILIGFNVTWHYNPTFFISLYFSYPMNQTSPTYMPWNQRRSQAPGNRGHGPGRGNFAAYILDFQPAFCREFVQMAFQMNSSLSPSSPIPSFIWGISWPPCYNKDQNYRHIRLQRTNADYNLTLGLATAVRGFSSADFHYFTRTFGGLRRLRSNKNIYLVALPPSLLITVLFPSIESKCQCFYTNLVLSL